MGGGPSTWQGVQEEALRRIRTREWPPGALIPPEAELAREFGCARATVNRALRELAEAGLLDRRRRAGTRVALDPVRKATLEIAVLRHEVEARGASYGYALVAREVAEPPAQVRSKMDLGPGTRPLHVRALHLASGVPYAYEDRWLNLETMPELAEVDLGQVSANEWLVRHAPYTSGDLTLYAAEADAEAAGALGCPERAAVFTMERVTWLGGRSITFVRLAFRPGHTVHTSL
jgi:GntR family transcriptional regulator, histidine utilization repressor